MTPEKLKEKIEKKFGSLSAFARIAGIDRYELQKHFSRTYPDSKFNAELAQKCRDLDAQASDGDITASELESLREAINASGGVVKFCRETVDSEGKPRFSKDSVFQILSGRRKRKTAKVKELFSHFELVT